MNTVYIYNPNMYICLYIYIVIQIYIYIFAFLYIYIHTNIYILHGLGYIYIYHVYTDCWQEALKDKRFKSKTVVGRVQNSDNIYIFIYIYIESVWMWSKLAILNCKSGIYIYIKSTL